MERHITKEVQIGNRWIGGNHPIAIQSMTNTKTEDVAATVAQIKQLTKVGCEIIRCAVPTQEAAAALTEIKKQITIPLVITSNGSWEYTSPSTVTSFASSSMIFKYE